MGVELPRCSRGPTPPLLLGVLLSFITGTVVSPPLELGTGGALPLRFLPGPLSGLLESEWFEDKGGKKVSQFSVRKRKNSLI